MKDKTYKQRTKFLGIPVVGERDCIWPEVELKKWQIVENLLIAGLKGMQNCIFDEGDLSLQSKPDGTFYVILRPSGVKPALEGIVGSAYCYVGDALTWDNLIAGNTYYLYVTRTPHTYTDSSSVRSLSTTKEQPNKLTILVGIADLKGNPHLDREPEGKVNIFDLVEHSSDNENPHGVQLIQDELLVRKRLVLGDGQDTEIVLRSGDEKITLPVACLVPGVVGFVTNGMEGVIVKSTARVAFVQTSRVSGVAGNVGEVSVGYFGQDPKVVDEQSFVVYNQGDYGINMKALIYHG